MLIGFDIDHRFNPSVCGQLAALVANCARDGEDQPNNTAIKIIVWEGDAKGIDDAALAGIHLSTIDVAEWHRTLERDSLERVNEVWNRLNFKP